MIRVDWTRRTCNGVGFVLAFAWPWVRFRGEEDGRRQVDGDYALGVLTAEGEGSKGG